MMPTRSEGGSSRSAEQNRSIAERTSSGRLGEAAQKGQPQGEAASEKVSPKPEMSWMWRKRDFAAFDRWCERRWQSVETEEVLKRYY